MNWMLLANWILRWQVSSRFFPLLIFLRLMWQLLLFWRFLIFRQAWRRMLSAIAIEEIWQMSRQFFLFVVFRRKVPLLHYKLLEYTTDSRSRTPDGLIGSSCLISVETALTRFIFFIVWRLVKGTSVETWRLTVKLASFDFANVRTLLIYLPHALVWIATRNTEIMACVPDESIKIL